MPITILRFAAYASRFRWLWIFRILELAGFWGLFHVNSNLAHDYVWAVVYSPIGISRLVQHGHSPFSATVVGILGGLLMNLNLGLLVYGDLQNRRMRRIAKHLWHFTPTAPKKDSWGERLPYLFIAAVSIPDVWAGWVTAVFLPQLNRVSIFVLLFSISAAKGAMTGMAITLVHSVNPFFARNIQLLTYLACATVATVSLILSLNKKIKAHREQFVASPLREE